MFFGPQMDSSNQDQESQVKMVRNFVVGESVGVVFSLSIFYYRSSVISAYNKLKYKQMENGNTYMDSLELVLENLETYTCCGLYSQKNIKYKKLFKSR